MGNSPFHVGARTPLRSVPGLHDLQAILLDFVHIWHLGYGQDLAGSVIVLMAKLKHYGRARKLDVCLSEAFELFDAWCAHEGRTTGVDEFSSAAFGMGKAFPGSIKSSFLDFFQGLPNWCWWEGL